MSALSDHDYPGKCAAGQEDDQNDERGGDEDVWLGLEVLIGCGDYACGGGSRSGDRQGYGE